MVLVVVDRHGCGIDVGLQCRSIVWQGRQGERHRDMISQNRAAERWERDCLLHKVQLGDGTQLTRSSQDDEARWRHAARTLRCHRSSLREWHAYYRKVFVSAKEQFGKANFDAETAWLSTSGMPLGSRE